MREFRLSTPGERVAGICTSVAVIVALAVLLYSMRSNVGLLIFCGLCAALIAALLVIYVMNVLKAAAVVDAEKKQLHVKGVNSYTLDLSNATLLQTFLRKSGQSTVRMLVFSDKDDEIIAMVPTMFVFRQGMWADPMAREMAKEMGIDFKQTVPDWQFDKELYQQHVKEETEREKREAKERRQKKMEMRIQKRKKQL